MERSSEALFALKPVTFRYKSEIDPQGISQFGLVAEDVEAINPDLVVRDKEGKVNTVRYEAVNAMLLNEFLKDHRKVQELEATVAHQQKSFARQQAQIAALASGLQKVSAELEISRPAPQVASLPAAALREGGITPKRQTNRSKNMKSTSQLIKTSTDLPSFRGGFILVILVLASAMLYRGQRS